MESGHEMLDHLGSSLSFPMKEPTPVPALPPYLIEPIWQQFSALIPERQTSHPLGCHRPRIPDRVVFEKLVQVLVFGCAYHRIADEECSATTLRERRDEWIEIGAMDTLREMALEAYDRLVGLEAADVAVDGCITKAPCGGEKAGRSSVDRGKRGIKRSTAVDANGIPLVHLQNRFRVVSYSGRHENSNLRTFVFRRRARSLGNGVALQRRLRLAPFPDAFGQFEGRRGPANSHKLGLRRANGARRHP